MQCVCCNGEDLVGEVVVKRLMPMAQRNGTVKVGGQGITQIDLKNAWALNSDGTPKAVMSPIYCQACGTEMHYVVGDKKPLREGPPPAPGEGEQE